MEKWKYFESQNENEKIVFLLRKHWFVLALPVLVVVATYLICFFAVTILPFVMPDLIKGFSYNLFVLGVSFALIASTTAFFSALLLYYLNVIIITNEHLVQITQERFFHRHVAQMEMIKIQDVSSKQSGLFASIFNFGTVDIQTAGELPNFLFVNIPNPGEVAKEIMEIKLKYSRKQHSGHHQATTPQPVNVESQPKVGDNNIKP